MEELEELENMDLAELTVYGLLPFIASYALHAVIHATSVISMVLQLLCYAILVRCVYYLAPRAKAWFSTVQRYQVELLLLIKDLLDRGLPMRHIVLAMLESTYAVVMEMVEPLGESVSEVVIEYLTNHGGWVFRLGRGAELIIQWDPSSSADRGGGYLKRLCHHYVGWFVLRMLGFHRPPMIQLLFRSAPVRRGTLGLPRRRAH